MDNEPSVSDVTEYQRSSSQLHRTLDGLSRHFAKMESYDCKIAEGLRCNLARRDCLRAGTCGTAFEKGFKRLTNLDLARQTGGRRHNRHEDGCLIVKSLEQ